MTRSYQWASPGDLNAFFGLFMDNMSNLVMLSGILIYGFGFPADIIFYKMIPGTAIGVLVGDLLYSVLAFRLAKRTSRSDVTAMPLGLDTPSTIGMTVTVIGPVYLASHDAIVAWQVGMATLVLIGLVKFVASFFGGWVQKIVPQAGLLGSLGGLGLVLLGFLPLMKIFSAPIVGLLALGLVLYALVAKHRLPLGIPGAFGAVMVGTVLYYILGNFGLLLGAFHAPSLNHLHMALPVPTLGFIEGLSKAWSYLPLAIPFGLLTIVGGINANESARMAGDNYDTKTILLIESFATLIAAVCGGVAQSTPYIGHPAYKAMGGRAAYTLATGLFVGIGGMFGLISFIVGLIPEAAIAPILLFVCMEIVGQSFAVCGHRLSPAVVLAYLPSVAELCRIMLTGFITDAGLIAASLPAKAGSTLHLLNVLGHGFIVTGTLWGGATALLIEGRLRAAAAFLFTMAAFTAFGFIHSPWDTGAMFLAWHGADPMVLHITVAYFLLGLALIAVSLFNHSRGAAESAGLR